MMFSILTLFPEMFSDQLNHSILGRAQVRGRVVVRLVPIRNFAYDRHRTVDDTPFGGGPGMVFKPDVLDRALASIPEVQKAHVVYLSPQGKRFDQKDAIRLLDFDHLVLICGHYEGIDERFIEKRVDEELSLGDFVLTGGEIPAMAVVDAVARLVPEVIGDATSYQEDSFYQGVLDCPHYTRPGAWIPEGESQSVPVPAVLLSGNHGEVASWRRRQALLRTLIRRSDLLHGADLTKAEKRLILALQQDLNEMAISEAMETRFQNEKKY